jgi:alpha-ribazole phosphatase
MKYGIPASPGAGIFCFLRKRAMAERLILVRHGDLGEDSRGRYIGRTDLPLSAEGERQAAALSQALGRWPGARLLCSPLLRCRRTAEIALKGRGKWLIDADLKEIDFGRWEGMTFAHIATDDPAAVDRWAALEDGFSFPGGEGIAAFQARIAAAAGRIAADPAETIVAVTHGGVIRFLICRFLGLEYRHYLLFDVRPGSVAEIRIADGRGVLIRLNHAHDREDI